MKLLFKILGYTLLGLIGLIAVALIAVQFISDEQYMKWITGAAESATGRELVINGEFDVNLGTKVSLLARDVSFANAAWGSQEHMVAADRLFVEVPLFPILKGVLDVTLEVDTPDILLETDAEGNGNWVFEKPDAEQEMADKPEPDVGKDEKGAPGLPIKPYIRNLEIKNLAFAFKDGAAGKNIAADVEQFRIFVDGEQIPLTLKAQYQGAPIVLGGSLGNIDQWFSNEQTDVTLEGTLNEAQLTVAGTAGPMLPQPQAHIDMALTAASLDTFSDFAGVPLPDLKGLEIALTTVAGDGLLSTDNLKIGLNDPRLTVDVAGKVEDLTGTGTIDVTAAIDSDSANELLSGLGKEIAYTLPPTVKLNGKVTGDLKALSVKDLEVVIQDDGLDVNLVGGLENLQAPEAGDVDLQIKLDSTAVIGRYIGTEIPLFGPFTGSAKLSTEGDHVRLDSLNLDLSDPLISAKIAGSAAYIGRDDDNNFTVNDIAANGDIRSEKLEEILEKFGVKLPGELPASFTLHAAAAGTSKELSLSELNASLVDDGVEVNLTGTIQNLLTMTGIEAEIAGKAADTSQFSKYAGTELPSLGALDLQGQVVSTDDSYRLENLDVHLAGEGTDVKVKAAIKDLVKLTEINAVVDGNLESLAALSEIAQTELPQTGPWKIHITADSGNLWESPLTVAAELGGESIDAKINAEVPNLKEPQTFQTNLNIDVGSFAQLLALIDREVPEDKPLKLTASATGKPGEYHIDDFSVKTKDADMAGNLAYLMPPAGGVERNSLTGKLVINNFDFTPLLKAKEEEAEALEEAEASGDESAKEDPSDQKASEKEPESSEEAASEPKGTAKKIFSDEPLMTGVLHNYDVDLQIDAENVKIRDGVTLDGNATVKLDDGFLSVDPLEIDQSEGGVGKGYLHLDTRAEEGVLDFVLNFDDIVSPRFGGLFDVDIDLDSRGTSVASLMGNLNGHAAASVKDIELLKSFMSQFGAGLLSNLNPLDSQKTLLECAVVKFDIEDGLVEFHKQIAAQTLEVTWIGGGKINLKTEEIDVGISPKARGALSSLTNIDLASLVHVGGTLAEPKIGLDYGDVAKKYVGYTAFVATGGLSFLAQKLVSTTQANVDQCERILRDLEKKE